MSTTDRLWKLMAMLAIILGFSSCAKEDAASESPIDVGEVVTGYQKSVRYQDTKQFDSDRDAITGMMLDIDGIRWAYWRMVSNDFKNGLSDFFSVPPEETGMNTPDMLEAFNKIVANAYNNGEAYDKALRNMSYAGMLPSLDDDYVTRGKASSTLSFSKTVQECAKLSRQSVLAVMQKGKWTTNPQKLSEFYYALPTEDRAGYSDPYTFWSDFSQGKLDSRAGQVFVNLYYLKPLDFAITSRDLKITPFSNTAIAAHKLATSAQDLILDAHPSVMAKMLSYGKDAHETVEASFQLMKSSTDVFSTANNNDSKKFSEALSAFMIQMGHNVTSYGPNLYKWGQNTGKVLGDMARDNASLDDLSKFAWSDWSDVEKSLFTVGSELYDVTTNETLMADNLISKLFAEGKKQGLKVEITFKDAGGDKYPMVILTDMETGEVRMGYTFNSDGNVVMLPGQGGVSKVVTTVNKKTKKVVKKTIIINENDSTIVECGLDDDDEIMEENPEDGYISLRSTPLEFLSNGGTLSAMIVTNYLYYKPVSGDDWITCSIPSDINQLNVKAAANPNPEKRVGKVTVVATDSKGKVLDKAVLTVTQEGKEITEEYITATPGTLEFSAEGGTLTSVINHSWAYAYTAIDYENKMAGWATIDTSEAEQGSFKLTVKASPNTTDEDRSGIITVYAAYNQDYRDAALNGNVDKNNVLVTTILVKHNNPGESSTRPPVYEVDFYINGQFQYWNEEKEKYIFSPEASRFTFTDKENATITNTENGDDLHVECTGKNYSNEEGTLSFDIIKWKNWSSSNLKVMNLKYHVAGTVSATVTAEVTNIPITEAGVEYLESEVSVSNGLKINAFDCKWKVGPTLEYISSPEDMVRIIINFRQEYWHWDNF